MLRERNKPKTEVLHSSHKWKSGFWKFNRMTMLARSFYKETGHGPRNGNGNGNGNGNANSNSHSNSNTYTNTNNNGNPNYKGKHFNPNYRGKNFNLHNANIQRANVNTPYKVKKFDPRNGNGQQSNGNANANYKGKNYNPNYKGKNFNRHAQNPNIDIQMTEVPSDEPNDIEMPDAPPLPDPRIEAFAMGALAVKEIAETMFRLASELDPGYVRN